MYSNWVLNIKGFFIDNRLIKCVYLCLFLNDEGNIFVVKNKLWIIIFKYVGDIIVMVYIDRKIE